MKLTFWIENNFIITYIYLKSIIFNIMIDEYTQTNSCRYISNKIKAFKNVIVNKNELSQ